MTDERKFEIEVLTRLTKIETLLEDFKGVEAKCNEAYNLSLSNKQRLDKMEDSYRWAIRTTIGATIGAIVSLIVSLVR